MSYFNNKPNQWIILLLVLLNISTLAFMWWNRPQPPNGPGAPPPPVRFLAEKLGFDKEQAEALRTQMDVYFDEIDSVRIQLQKNRRALLDLLSEDTIDSTAVEQIMAADASLHTFENRLFIDHYRSISKICTVSQKQQLNQVFSRAMSPPSLKSRPGMDRSLR